MVALGVKPRPPLGTPVRLSVSLTVRSLLVTILLSLFHLSQAQSVCEIFQLEHSDSTNSRLACVKSYNARGQLVNEKFTGFRDGATVTPDGEYFYTYSDTTLTGWLLVQSTGDSIKMKFEYNAAGQLARQSYFVRRALPTEGSKSDPNTIATGPAMQGAGTWMQTSLVNFSYDSKGRKILYDATRLHYSPQNMYKWEYDEQDRVVKQESYSRGRLTWKEDYQYFDWGYRYWRTWYDSEGNMRHEYDQESSQYWPLYFFTVKTDKQGRETEIRVTNEKQKLHERTEIFYGSNGKILRKKYYDASDQLILTHIYNHKEK